MTRGDSAVIQVDLTDPQGQPYEMQEADTLTMTVRRSVASDLLIQKVVTGTNEIRLEQQDTKELDFGRYVYDIQLDTADGDTFTVIGVESTSARNFVLTPEVTE